MRRTALAAVAAIACCGCYLHHGREGELDAAAPTTLRLVALGTGDDHTCAIDDGGGLWCWGFAQQGQLGEGSGDPARCAIGITEGPVVDQPVRVLASVLAVAGGPSHTCAITGDGYACWGANCQGQLGNGDIVGSLRPEVRAVPTLGVWTGAGHSCIARDEGFACTGANERGQLGLGTMSPLSEPGATSFAPVEGLPRVIDAGLGVAHTCALDASGVVWCWGANGAGQLGDGTFDVRSSPSFVRGLTVPATAIAAGDRHTCAATDDGAWCWGWNARGQLGIGAACAEGDEECAERPLPERVRFDGPVDDVSAGSEFSCLRSGGEVWCWGANDVGQLGRGSRGSSAGPVRVLAIDDAIAISCGANHACAILGDGRVMCWGRNAQGQLGDGTHADALAPVETSFAPR